MAVCRLALIYAMIEPVELSRGEARPGIADLNGNAGIAALSGFFTDCDADLEGLRIVDEAMLDGILDEGLDQQRRNQRRLQFSCGSSTS